MRLVRPPASGASMSSIVSKPNPSCDISRRHNADLNPVSYTVTIPNTNYTRFTVRAGRMCPVRLCLVTSLTMTLTISEKLSLILTQLLTVLDAPDAGGRILPVPAGRIFSSDYCMAPPLQ